MQVSQLISLVVFSARLSQLRTLACDSTLIFSGLNTSRFGKIISCNSGTSGLSGLLFSYDDSILVENALVSSRLVYFFQFPGVSQSSIYINYNTSQKVWLELYQKLLYADITSGHKKLRWLPVEHGSINIHIF